MLVLLSPPSGGIYSLVADSRHAKVEALGHDLLYQFPRKFVKAIKYAVYANPWDYLDLISFQCHHPSLSYGCWIVRVPIFNSCHHLLISGIIFLSNDERMPE